MRHRTHNRRPGKVNPGLPLLGEVLLVLLEPEFPQPSREPQLRAMVRWDGWAVSSVCHSRPPSTASSPVRKLGFPRALRLRSNSMQFPT